MSGYFYNKTDGDKIIEKLSDISTKIDVLISLMSGSKLDISNDE